MSQAVTQPGFQAVSEWAQISLQLSFMPFRYVLSRIATSISSITENDSKQTGGPAQPGIEKKLIVWINDQNNAGVCLKGNIIREKAKWIILETNYLLLANK